MPKVQASEATKLLNAEKVKLINNIKHGQCSDGQSGVIGRNGGVQVSGTPIRVNGDECPTGCRLTYTFNNTVAKELRGKTLTVLALKNTQYAVDEDNTTLDKKFISSSFNNYVSSQCPELTGNGSNTILEGPGTDGFSVGQMLDGTPGNNSNIPNNPDGEVVSDVEDVEPPPAPPPSEQANIIKSINERLSEPDSKSTGKYIVIEP